MTRLFGIASATATATATTPSLHVTHVHTTTNTFPAVPTAASHHCHQTCNWRSLTLTHPFVRRSCCPPNVSGNRLPRLQSETGTATRTQSSFTTTPPASVSPTCIYTQGSALGAGKLALVLSLSLSLSLVFSSCMIFNRWLKRVCGPTHAYRSSAPVPLPGTGSSGRERRTDLAPELI